MKRVGSLTLVVLLVVTGLLLAPGTVWASRYTRYVLLGPNGGRVFLFTTPGAPGLEDLLRRVYGAGIPSLPPSQVPGQGTPTGGGGRLVPNETPPPEEQPQEEQPEEVPPGGSVGVVLTPEETLMVKLINQERAKAGLSPLSVDPRLVTLCRKKSQDMIDKGYFSHYSPTYGSPFDMMNEAGIHYRTAGENLAGAPTVERAHAALMQSPGHRANILNPAFQKVGVGVAKGGPYGMMFTQMFIGD